MLGSVMAPAVLEAVKPLEQAIDSLMPCSRYCLHVLLSCAVTIWREAPTVTVFVGSVCLEYFSRPPALVLGTVYLSCMFFYIELQVHSAPYVRYSNADARI